MHNIFLVFLLLTFVPATGHSRPAIDQIEIAPNLYWFRPDTPIGNQSSLVFIAKHGALLVDANIDTVAPYLETFLNERAANRPWYASISHHHGDHAQGLETLGKRLISIVPAAQRQRLESTPLTTPESPPLQSNALPSITFSDKLSLHFSDETAVTMPLPAKNSHTDGDSVLYFVERRVLYVGDHYFADRLPIIDFDGGGSIDGYMQNLQWIVDSFPPETKVIPGHGLFAPDAPRVDSLGRFAVWVRRVECSVAAVDQFIHLGISEDDAVATGLPNRLAELGAKPRYISEAQWIRSIYTQRMTEGMVNLEATRNVTNGCPSVR